MALRVRSAEGEISLPDRRALEQNVRVGLVEVDDEVRLSDEGPWVPVRTLVARPTKDFRGTHWYVLAGLLALVGIFGGGFIAVLFVVSCHAIWLTVMAPRGIRQKRTRWW